MSNEKTKLFELRELLSLMEVSPVEKVLRLSLFVDMIARKTTFRCLSSITVKTAL